MEYLGFYVNLNSQIVANPQGWITAGLFWIGYNDLAGATSTPAQVVGYIATCIGNLTAAGNNDYFVLDIINGNQIANQFTGQSVYNNIVACNALLLAAYGNRYIAIRKPLISLYNASLPLDVVDFNNDCVPNSLHAVLK